MNLAVLRRSRPNLRPGDIAVMLPPDGQYLYARVIDTDTKALSCGGAILIYIYRVRSTAKVPVPELLREQLLIPPLMTNKRPWTMGYFENVEHRPLTPLDRLPVHCFADFRGNVDEQGAPLPGSIAPLRERGLHGYGSIDDEISNALGIPLAPEW